jgi:hypothetical protein
MVCVVVCLYFGIILCTVIYTPHRYVPIPIGKLTGRILTDHQTHAGRRHADAKRRSEFDTIHVNLDIGQLPPGNFT